MSFILAAIGVLIWLMTGPIFNFSNTWLLTISTITDVIIFLMVFSIQNTQFRDSKAIQLKLNELIAVDKKARDSFIGLESLTDEELSDLDIEFQKLLATIEGPSPLHKLHHTIKQARNKRPSFYRQAGHLVDQLIKTVESGQ
jgi:low affinity Fe/Cu permease